MISSYPSVLSLLTCAALVFTTARATAGYIVTDLGIAGAYTTPNYPNAAINASGAVAFSRLVRNSSGFESGEAFLYQSGSARSLGTLGGLYSYSQGYGINDAGQVVGASSTKDSSTHAFLYSHGKMLDLGVLGVSAFGSYSSANAINNAGQVVGDSRTRTAQMHGFLYSNGKMTDLGTLGGNGNPSDAVGSFSYANGINQRGQVVGLSSTASGNNHAFLYFNGKMTDLGTLQAGGSSGANAINNAGQVVGSASVHNSAADHAFLYANGKWTDLGALGGVKGIVPGTVFSYSTANAINNAGQIVGTSTTNAIGPMHAFLYSSGKLTDLNRLLLPPSSGWTLYDAVGINDRGQIVAYAAPHGLPPTSAVVHTVLLTAAFGSAPNAAPEPATLSLLGIGLAGLACCRWCRRQNRSPSRVAPSAIPGTSESP